MMTTTHVAMGLAGVSLLVPVSPELATVAGFAAVAGGIFPDLDVVGAHRKSLHHPEVYRVLALVAAGIAVLRPGVATVAVAAFFASAAIHSLSDVFGGGLGLRPWENDDERGIYLHTADRWVPPKRWVRYDGAPEDLLAVTIFSIPPWVAFGSPIRELLVLGLGVSVLYVAVRKPMVDVYERLTG